MLPRQSLGRLESQRSRECFVGTAFCVSSNSNGYRSPVQEVQALLIITGMIGIDQDGSIVIGRATTGSRIAGDNSGVEAPAGLHLL